MDFPDRFRQALRQQLEGDRMLGIRSVPLRLPARRPETAHTAHGLAAQDRSIPRVRRSSSTPKEKADRLRKLDETQVKGCTKCPLCQGRTQTVFGQGNPDARLVFVGEGPGFEEDKQGLAFVGPAGQLLTKMIAAMGLTRDDVYICNVVKCRPPGNRTPTADEILACHPYLREQLAIIDPEMIIALGAPAAKTLLNTAEPIGKLRGRFHEYDPTGEPGQGHSIPLMPTYHPAYLLRNPADKKKSWDDLQVVMARMGLKGAV